MVRENELQRFVGILDRVRFRDWRFRVGVSDARCWLQVTFRAPDADTGQDAAQRGRKWFLSPHMTDSEVVQTALMAVLAAVEHEAREDFLYRGAAIFGPHFDVEALHALAERGNLAMREEPNASDEGPCTCSGADYHVPACGGTC